MESGQRHADRPPVTAPGSTPGLEASPPGAPPVPAPTLPPTAGASPPRAPELTPRPRRTRLPLVKPPRAPMTHIPRLPPGCGSSRQRSLGRSAGHRCGLLARTDSHPRRTPPSPRRRRTPHLQRDPPAHQFRPAPARRRVAPCVPALRLLGPAHLPALLPGVPPLRLPETTTDTGPPPPPRPAPPSPLSPVSRRACSRSDDSRCTPPGCQLARAIPPRHPPVSLPDHAAFPSGRPLDLLLVLRLHLVLDRQPPSRQPTPPLLLASSEHRQPVDGRP